MRVLIAGATGVVGRQLVPLLVADGHEVVASTRSPRKADDLRAQGARPIVLDILDAEATLAGVRAAEPEVIVHEATALSELGNDLRHFDRYFAATNRLRTAGAENLLAGARSVGTTRFLAQSFCGWPFETVGGPVKDESAPLEPNPPAGFRQTLAAIRRLEQLVGDAPGGVVLRYAGFYGPETSLAPGGPQIVAIRRRRFPLVGDGGGVFSFLHVADAAAATQAALTRGEGVYNIADDEPAPVREWLPYLAQLLGAPAPRRVPVWLARLVAGEAAVRMMTRSRGASNERAKRELGWTPAHASWRDGFRAELAGAA